jgi:hypothetical protein
MALAPIVCPQRSYLVFSGHVENICIEGIYNIDNKTLRHRNDLNASILLNMMAG